MKRKILSLVLLATFIAIPHSALAKNPKRVSIYDLDVKLTDQNNKTVGLDVFKGHPTAVAMFYASCPYACPMLIGKLKSVERDLPKKNKKNMRFLLISFNPEEDSVAALKDVEKRYKTDANWRFARTDKSTVREIAAVLGIKYKQQSDGEFDHTSFVSLVNKKGEVEKRVDTAKESLKDLAASFSQFSQ
jgi:protein SCO1/2